MGETVLFDYSLSSASFRVRIALNLAGIKYTTETVNLRAGEQRSKTYLAKNPQGLVPSLAIDGLLLTQSLAILEYLDSTRDLGLIPTDPAKRAAVMALAQSIAVDIHPVCNLRVATYAAGLTDTPDTALTDWMRRFIGPGLAAFEMLLGSFEQSPYCCGDSPGLADICLIPQLYNARRWGADISAIPRILGVSEACETHPAFVDAAPEAVPTER